MRQYNRLFCNFSTYFIKVYRLQLHLHWLLTESWFWIIPELIFSEFINWNTSCPFRVWSSDLRFIVKIFFKLTVDIGSDWLVRLTDQNQEPILTWVFILRFLRLCFSVTISCWWQWNLSTNCEYKQSKCLFSLSTTLSMFIIYISQENICQ